MRKLLFLLSALPLIAAVDGTVVNQATGKPQAKAVVTLFKLGNGMEAVESFTTGPDGKFAIKASAEGAHLIQASFDGVVYNQMLQPGAPSSGLTINVFPAVTAMPATVKLDQHMMLLEPNGDKLMVRETYVFNNTGTTTWNDTKNGTLRFSTPKDAESVEATTSTLGVPIRRNAEKTANGTYKVDQAVKPGETRIDVGYTVPYASPAKFNNKFAMPATRTMIAVPNGVTIKGPGITDKGKEPTTQASVYEVTGKELALEIEGAGQLQSAASGGGGGGGESAEAEEDSGPGVQQIAPKVWDNMPYLLGITIAILLLAFIILYKSGGVEAKKR